MNTEKKWTALGVLLGVTLMATIGAVLVGVDSDDRPQPQDTQGRSLIKINEILYNSIQGKGTNQINTSSVGTNTVTGALSVTNFNVIVSETSFVGTRATAAFAAGQVINNGDNVAVPPFTITNACPVGRSGLIAFVALTASNTTFTPSIRIKFYSSTNVTWYSNSQAAGTYFTNASARLFNWDLQPLAAESSGDSASVQDVSQWIPFSATADGNLYFTPIALSAGTPVANQPYLLKIKVLPR